MLFGFISGQSMNAYLTLYKNGYTLVKQPVNWNIPAGDSQITYSLIPNQLYPETPFLSLMSNTEIIFQRLNKKLFFSDSFYRTRLGSVVEAYYDNGKSVYGQLLEYNSKSVTVQSKSWLKTIPREELTMISIKEKIVQPQFRPKLEWDINAHHSDFINGNLMYMSGGIDWKAVYRLITKSNESSATLFSEAHITNETDLNFEEAHLKLVEGDLHKSSKAQPMQFGPKLMSSKREETSTQKNMEESPLGDYYEYIIKNKVSLMSGETVTLPLYTAREIFFNKTYIFQNRERQKKEEPLTVELEISNLKDNNLFIPLPAGKVEIYIEALDGNIEFIGEDNISQVPKGENAKLIAGRAFDVIGKRKVLNYDRQRKSEEASIEVEIQNKKMKSVKVKIIEHITGDWVIKDVNKQFIKEDATTIYFPLTIEAESSEKVLYTYKKEWD